MQIAYSEYEGASSRAGVFSALRIALGLAILALFTQPAIAEVIQTADNAMFRDGSISQFDAATNRFDLTGPRHVEAGFAPSSAAQPLTSFDDDMRIRLAPPPSEVRDAAASSQPKGPDLLQPKYQWRSMAKLEIG